MRIAAISDVHLGIRQFTTREQGRNAREVDVERAWREAVRQIVRSNPDLVCVAGDVFHHARVSTHAKKAYLDGISKLLATTHADIVIAAGNHDAGKTAEVLTPLKLADTLDYTERVRTCTAPEVIDVDEAIVTVLPYFVASGEPHEMYFERDDTRLNVLVVHGPLDHPNLPPFYTNGAPRVEDLARHFDVIVAGDYHIAMHLPTSHDCLAFYCGSTERTTSHIWQEEGPHGWMLVDTNSQSRPVRHVPVRTREMRDIVHDAETAEDVNRHLQDVLDHYRKKVPERAGEDMVRMTFRGVARDEKGLVDQDLVRKLKLSCFHFQIGWQFRDAASLTLADRRVERKTLREQAEEFFAADTPEVRARALTTINPAWAGEVTE